MLAVGIILVRLLLLANRAVAEDVGEICVNVSETAAAAACTRAIRSGGHNAHHLAVLYGNRCAAYVNRLFVDLRADFGAHQRRGLLIAAQ